MALAAARHEEGVRLEEILLGPAHQNDGTLNLLGGLRTSMATTGYENLKAFQKAEVAKWAAVIKSANIKLE